MATRAGKAAGYWMINRQKEYNSENSDRPYWMAEVDMGSFSLFYCVNPAIAFSLFLICEAVS